MIVFFFGEAEFSQNYNCLIIILSSAREFLNRKTIKMCKKGRLPYKSRYLSYALISYSAQSNYNKLQHHNIKMIVVLIIFGQDFQSHSLQSKTLPERGFFVSGTCDCRNVEGWLKWVKMETWSHSGRCLVCK